MLFDISRLSLRKADELKTLIHVKHLCAQTCVPSVMERALISALSPWNQRHYQTPLRYECSENIIVISIRIQLADSRRTAISALAMN